MPARPLTLAEMAAVVGELWQCPSCGNRPAPECVLCRGSGLFDPTLLTTTRRLREALPVLALDVAEQLGVSETTFLRMERGDSLVARSLGHRQAAGRLLVRYLGLLRHECP